MKAEMELYIYQNRDDESIVENSLCLLFNLINLCSTRGAACMNKLCAKFLIFTDMGLHVYCVLLDCSPRIFLVF